MKTNLKVLCVIPSRISSSRLPRKPVLPIQGQAMILWTYQNALRCKNLTTLVVATDSQEVADIIQQVGGLTTINMENFATGSDRVAAIAEHYPDMDVIINLQGDEPFIQPSMLNSLIAPYLNGQNPDMTTLACQLLPHEYDDPGVVKVVCNLHNQALYFSRANIPYQRQQSTGNLYHHIGAYAFSRNFIKIYPTLNQTPLEITESLEQLRVLEHGYQITVCFSKHRTLEINTPEEYKRAQNFVYIPENT